MTRAETLKMQPERERKKIKKIKKKYQQPQMGNRLSGDSQQQYGEQQQNHMSKRLSIIIFLLKI